MLIHNLNTEVKKGRRANINFPNKKSIILQGSNKEQVLYMVECILTKSYMGYYDDLDKRYGFNYYTPTSKTELQFNDGVIIGEKQIVRTKGVIPKIHCLRYLNNGVIRSSLCSQTTNNNIIDIDMTKYSTKIPLSLWTRIATLVNNFFDREVVILTHDYDLIYNFSDEKIEFEQLVYQLVAECFLTPVEFRRVLLLSDMNVSGKEQAQLIDLLDNIKGHSLCLSIGNINFKDVAEDSPITFLRV